MNMVLHGLIRNTANVSLDDILIASKTTEEHCSKLDLVFSRLREAGLKIRLERTVQSKADAVNKFPTSTSADKTRSFLGLTGYYRQYIRG